MILMIGLEISWELIDDVTKCNDYEKSDPNYYSSPNKENSIELPVVYFMENQN